ncbi:MAG: tetratricopeptide repeat protein [Chloroflexota bacterium]
MAEIHKISGCDNPDRKADVIFVHGLGGDPIKTWRHGADDSTSWPHWLGAEFPQVGVWSVGYAASPSRFGRLKRLFGWGSPDSGHGMSLPQRAKQVLDQLTLKNFGRRPILFIGHSLGGLLVKEVLRAASDAKPSTSPERHGVFESTHAVLFLATPHAGAELATFLTDFGKLFGATVTLEDLRAHHAHLSELFDWYRNHATAGGIRTKTYYESRPVAGVLPIVNATSAHPGTGDDPIALDEDHLSIAKPSNTTAQAYEAARFLLREVVLGLGQSAKMDRGATTISHHPPPQKLPPQARRYFGRAAECALLVERLRNRENTAVVGPAGMGKTALAAEAVRAVVGTSPKTLAESPYADGVLFVDLYAMRGSADTAWNHIANSLRSIDFAKDATPFDRATEACKDKRILVVIEGGEEADGRGGRARLSDIKRAFSDENRTLLLTRDSTQAPALETVALKESLGTDDAAALFDSLVPTNEDSQKRITPEVRSDALKLLHGHPLAITWAVNMLAREDQPVSNLVDDWKAKPLPSLSHPEDATRTLEWLFERSMRGLDERCQHALAAAAILAHAPFPAAAIAAALDASDEGARHALAVLIQRSLLRLTDGDSAWTFTHALGYGFARKHARHDAELTTRLAIWLQNELHALADQTDFERLALRLPHLGAILGTSGGVSLWGPIVNGALYGLTDRLTEAGQSPLVGATLGFVANWFDQLPAGTLAEPIWQRERSIAWIRLGDVALAQGDLTSARDAYQTAFGIARLLADGEPTNAQRQYDLSVTHNKLGDVTLLQGDLTTARAAFQASLTIRQHLADADPSSAERQRNLVVGLNRLGDVALVQSDLASARDAFDAALRIAQDLADAAPSNSEWQRDLSVSHIKLGDVALAQGDLATARDAFQASLTIRQDLTNATPSNTARQRDLAVSLTKLGDAALAQGDLANARDAFLRALDISQRLADVDPSNAQWQRDLSVSHNKLGDIAFAQCDVSTAHAAFQASLTIRQRLAGADPSNAQWQRDLSSVSKRLAETFANAGAVSDAASFAERSLEIDERLSSMDPTNVMWQQDVEVSRQLVERLRETPGG